MGVDNAKLVESPLSAVHKNLLHGGAVTGAVNETRASFRLAPENVPNVVANHVLQEFGFTFSR